MDIYYSLEWINNLKRECSIFQEKYNFNIPIYILEELVKEDYDKNTVCLLINMARLNNRFSEEEAKILKREYCKMIVYNRYVTIK